MGRKILITGANKGIGFGLAKALLSTAPEFDTIIMTARNPELGLAAKARLGDDPRLDFHVLDVTSIESITAARDYISSKYGLLDVLFNNAGIWILATENAHLTAPIQIETNFFGLKNMTEVFLPIMQENGHIVNNTGGLGHTRFLENPELGQTLLKSDLTVDELVEVALKLENIPEYWAEQGWELTGFNGVSAYSHSKALVYAYTRILANELKAQGSKVRVNGVHPGWVKTDMGGESAPLTLEEGVSVVLQVIRDTSEITGKYWALGLCEDFS